MSKKKNWLSGALAVAVVFGSSSMSFAAHTAARHDSTQYPVFPKYSKHVTITWWSWVSSASALVDAFEKAYPTIKVVHYQVPGSEYTKLTTVLKAGSGAPDDVQIEYQMMPQFVNTGDLVNIASYDQKYMSWYPSWVQKQVTFGGKLYAMPEDVAPLGLIYRPNLFEKYHLAVPATWAQFAADAAKIHKANSKVYLSDFPVNDGGNIMGLLWQGGAFPFHQMSNGSWKIDFTSPAAEKVMNFWGNLIKKGYIKADTDFTPQWNHEVGQGMYAAVEGAAWSPDYQILPAMPKKYAPWHATFIPQWVPGQHVDGNWGGSTTAVTTQTKHPRAAALFAAWINLSEQGLSIGNSIGGYFTASKNSPSIPAFTAPIAVLGGQRGNLMFEKESPWVNTSFEWSPWTLYVYSEMQVEFTKAADGRESWDQALANIQQNVAQFARTQGYSVSQ